MWSSKKETVKVRRVKSTAYLSPLVVRKIELLMENYPHTEWIGYLTGKQERLKFYVNNLNIPPHEEASVSTAETEVGHIPKNTIGVIHSHHTMGAFHSGTDNAHVDTNYPLSIVVDSKGKYDATSCVITSETIFTVDCIVKSNWQLEKWLKVATKNIDKGKVTFPVYSTKTGGFWDYYNGYTPEHNPEHRPMGDRLAGDRIWYRKGGVLISETVKRKGWEKDGGEPRTSLFGDTPNLWGRNKRVELTPGTTEETDMAGDDRLTGEELY